MIGERIKERRLRLKMSLDELAEKTGYSHRSSISKIERGERELTQSKITIFADALGVSPSYLMGLTDETGSRINLSKPITSVKIPVLGHVPAGIPLEAIEDIVDYEEVSVELFYNEYEYFALRISGDSMSPQIEDKSTVIVRKQSHIESGQIAIILINGHDATCKKVMKSDGGLTLIPLNPNHEPRFFSPHEIEELPVQILGVVIEVRKKLI